MMIVVSFLLPIVAVAIVTALVSRSVQRSPATTAWKGTRAGVLFVVCLRRWQRVLIRSVGITSLVLGGIMVLVALTDHSDGPTQAMGIAGTCMAIGGSLFIWFAHMMAQLRLEVTPDTIWAFPLVGSPKQVALSDIVTLEPLYSNNFGGINARGAKKKLFYATRIMLGYPQLIDYLRAYRPDLPIPIASRPLQASATPTPPTTHP